MNLQEKAVCNLSMLGRGETRDISKCIREHPDKVELRFNRVLLAVQEAKVKNRVAFGKLLGDFEKDVGISGMVNVKTLKVFMLALYATDNKILDYVFGVGKK